MKRYILALVSGLVICSCTLDEKIISSSVPETFYQTPEECLAGLNGCYTNIRNILNNRNYFTMSECQSDIMFINRSDQPDATLQVSPSNPQFGKTMWQYGYQGVMRANAMEAAIRRAPFSDAEKAPLLAEATVLRSFFYYILTINFGDVPFYKDEVTDANNSRIAQLPRMSAEATRDTLIKDLRKWILEEQALDMKRTNDADNAQRYRCGAAVGLMLAGKMCLWNERWSDAIDFYNALEDIYGNGAGNPAGVLDKYPLSEIPFANRQVNESILEISNISIDYGLQVSGNLAVVCTPQRTVKAGSEDAEVEEEDYNDEDYYQGIGIPELGNAARTQTPIRPTFRFYKGLMPYNSTDRRRSQYDVSGNKLTDAGGYLAWGWVGYTRGDDRTKVDPEWKFFDGTSNKNGRPYLGNKFWCFGMQYTLDSNSYKFFRYGEVLLRLAEAWLQKGDHEKACAYLNEVRRRAALDPVSPSLDADELLAEIQDECARELFGEFQRKHDLVRWGLWYDYVVKYNAAPKNTAVPEEGGENNTRLMTNIRPCHEYYPIPDEQITYSNGALDNKEYNKYGL